MPDETRKPFNPLEKENLAESIATAIGRASVQPLPPPKFSGAGLYFLYYTGSFTAYAPLVKINRRERQWPIYIGKAMPPGVRKGGGGENGKNKSNSAIFDRLRHHVNSISQAENLELGDFHCRWLAMDEAFIHLGEMLLITKFRPLWNVALDGFGNNPVGGPRTAGKRSAWDTVHPGRQGRAAAPVDLERQSSLLNTIGEHFVATLPKTLPKR